MPLKTQNIAFKNSEINHITEFSRVIYFPAEMVISWAVVSFEFSGSR
jgi:hypothetical protein